MLNSIHLFTQAIPMAPLQVHYYSGALPTQRRYCVGVSCLSATGEDLKRTLSLLRFFVIYLICSLNNYL